MSRGRGGTRGDDRLRMSLIVSALIVVACVVAMVASGILQAWVPPEEEEPPGRDESSSYAGARIDEVVAGLRDTAVYTDPYYAGDLSEAEREGLTARLDAMDAEVRIAALTVSDADESSGNSSVLADRIARTLGEEIGPVVVIVVSDHWADYSAYQYDTDPPSEVERPTSADGGEPLGRFLTRVVETFETAPPEPDAALVPPPHWTDYSGTEDTRIRLWGYPIGAGVLGAFIGLMFGAVIGGFTGLGIKMWREVKKR